jgi:dihydropyrimidinase
MRVSRLVQLMSENPARLMGLYPRKGTLQVGSDADLVVFDQRRRDTLAAATQHSAADYTLYEGRSLTGAPVLTMQRGEVIAEQGRVVAQPGRARFLATETGHRYK